MSGNASFDISTFWHPMNKRPRFSSFCTFCTVFALSTVYPRWTFQGLSRPLAWAPPSCEGAPLVRGRPPLARAPPSCGGAPVLRGRPSLARAPPSCEGAPLLRGRPLLARAPPLLRGRAWTAPAGVNAFPGESWPKGAQNTTEFRSRWGSISSSRRRLPAKRLHILNQGLP